MQKSNIDALSAQHIRELRAVPTFDVGDSGFIVFVSDDIDRSAKQQVEQVLNQNTIFAYARIETNSFGFWSRMRG